MEEQATFQALRQILPELQAKLRSTIQEQYQNQLQKVHLYYRQYHEDSLKRQESQLISQAEKNEDQLRRELSLIQRQRQQWLILENNYKRTILELTQRLSEAHKAGNISILTEIYPPNVETQQQLHCQTSGAWKRMKDKKQIKELPIPVLNHKSSQKISHPNDYSRDLLHKHLFSNEKDDQNLLEDRSLIVGELSDCKMKNWKTNKQFVPDAQEFKDRGRRQDTMVLSPPKTEEPLHMKASVLEPPSSNPSTKSSLFWNEDGKKKLLSMIRNIK